MSSSTHPPILVRWMLRLHGNDRGGIGILLLLTVWALVALLAMTWNSAEYAARRRNVQNAADAAAHSAHVWVARTTNVTTASNLVIGQNGSAEVILRAVPPTRQTIQTRFNNERNRTNDLLTGRTVNAPEENYPDCEYFDELVGTGAWRNNGRGDNLQKELRELTPAVKQALDAVLLQLPAAQRPQLVLRVNEALRRNNIALNWMVNTYVGGSSGPVATWIENDIRPRLRDILATLDAEQAIHDSWVAQTDPAVNSTTPQQLRDQRREIHQYQEQVRQLTPRVIEQQNEALSSLYKVKTTSGVPGRVNENGTPTDVTAPIHGAVNPEGQAHTDSIRSRYPAATERRFGSSSPDVWIDPVNVNVGHSAIWHPGISVPAPPGIVLNGQVFQTTFGVGGGEWGRVPCAPLSRYVNDRVYRDRERLRAEPRQIDQLRSALRGRIYPPPVQPTLDQFPQRIPDPNPNPDTNQPTIPLPPESIPQLPLPPNLTQQAMDLITQVNQRSQEYNRRLRDYTNDLRRLISMLDRMYNNVERISDVAGTRFADATWLGYVNSNRDLVLREMGSDKTFMVLATYGLRPIPDWAVNDMRSDVRRRVYQEIYGRVVNGLTNAARGRLENWALGVLGAAAQQNPRANPGAIRSQARQFANANAPRVAQYAARLAAMQISVEVADEWVSRPWPYEIEPPKEHVPPPKGVNDEERKKHFTSLAATVTEDESSPRILFGGVFTKDTRPLVAFAQAETFNWNEFNEGYGASDAYDRVTGYGHGDEGGMPRPWRLSSIGGWNWQSRLSRSDALSPTIRDNSQFRDYLQEGGVTPNGEESNSKLDPITLH